MSEFSRGSLRGIRVVDLSRVLGGPYCTQILAYHGADVLKIEPPQGDETRGWGPPFDAHGTASYFLGLNRNKRGMTLDLTLPAHREQLLGLLEDADVLVENFKTGTLEKWGLGWGTLERRFPRLVHCRVSVRTPPIICWMAACRDAPATRTPTSIPTTRSPRAPSRSSLRWANPPVRDPVRPDRRG
jgi:crotonobetainyl-CoA:carnitine CoA-transferase CaiB-like acyl-CoA transferase